PLIRLNCMVAHSLFFVCGAYHSANAAGSLRKSAAKFTQNARRFRAVLTQGGGRKLAPYGTEKQVALVGKVW
ncbi:MAG: hypothetical protein IJK52_01010, partial [Oscillospiraceae bacterium]|nr:hypothetical protein [Oscillospiraceae bacterium]